MAWFVSDSGKVTEISKDDNGGSGGGSGGCGCLMFPFVALLLYVFWQWCLHDGSKFFAATLNDWTPLMECVSDREATEAAVEDRLVLGDDINAHAKDGETPISVAAKYSNAKIVRFLLQKGANPDVANEDGITPVMYAAANADAEVLPLLLPKVKNAAAKDKKRRDALTYALEEGYLRAANVTRLVNAGCDVNAVNEDGCTPLILCFRGEAKEAKWESGVPLALLKTGRIKVDAADKEGNTALMYVTDNNYNDKFLEYLLACKASVNAVNNDGDTALILAVKKNYKSSVQVLMKHGADPDLKNKAGESARSIAKSKENADITRLLK